MPSTGLITDDHLTEIEQNMEWHMNPESPEGPKALSKAYPVSAPHPLHCPSPSGSPSLSACSRVLSFQRSSWCPQLPLPHPLPCPLSCPVLHHPQPVCICPMDASSLEDRPQGGGEPPVFTLHSAPRQCLAYNGCSEITERQKRLIAFTPQPSTLEVRIRGWIKTDAIPRWWAVLRSRSWEPMSLGCFLLSSLTNLHSDRCGVLWHSFFLQRFSL